MESKEIFEKLTFFFHPSLSFFEENCYSIKNLRYDKDKANFISSFLLSMIFLKKINLSYFFPKSFLLTKENLPVIDFGSEISKEEIKFYEIYSFCKELLFGSKNLRRVKTSLKQTAQIFVNHEEKEDLDLFFIDLMLAFNKDGIETKIHPLYSVGIEWEPPFSKEERHFSPKNIFYKNIVKNWAKANKSKFVCLDFKIPYPYSSLQTFFESLFEDKEEGIKIFEEALKVGNVKETILDYLEKSNFPTIFYCEKVDNFSEKLLLEIFQENKNVILFLDKNGKSFGRIKKIHFLSLLNEGEEWLKENLRFFGLEKEDDILDYLCKEGLKQFSPFTPLFPTDLKILKNVDEDCPLYETSKFFEKRDEEEIEKSLILTLIKLGQIENALQKIKRVKIYDAQINFLEIYAKSFLPNFQFDFKDFKGIEKLEKEDAFLLELLYSQSLWVNGDFEKGESKLKELLKKEKSQKRRCSVFNQLFLLYLNSGEIEKADECIKEISFLKRDSSPKENLLYNLAMALSLKNKNALTNSYKYLEEARRFAIKGRFLYHEVWIDIEMANILRQLGNFDNAELILERSLKKAKVLLLENVEEVIHFDKILVDVERGLLLKTQKEIESHLGEKGKNQIEKSIEGYWLSRILFLRGEYSSSLNEIEKHLKNRKNLTKELSISFDILKANVLFNLNEIKSLQLLIRKLSMEEILSVGPDYFLEYYSILLYGHSKRICTISSEQEKLKDVVINKCSPISKMTYYLALGKVTNNIDESEKFAKMALNLGRDFNNLYIILHSLLILQKIGRLPPLEEKELERIENFIKENKIVDVECHFIKTSKIKKIKEEPVVDDEISFLSEVSHSNLKETLIQLVKIVGVDEVAIISKEGNLYFEGGLSKNFVTENMLKEVSPNYEGKRGNYSFFSYQSTKGFLGIMAASQITKKKKEIFKIYLELLNEKEEEKKEFERDEEFGILDKIILGKSEAIKNLKGKIVEASRFNFPVLITGEAGSGKEVCAKGIHLLSSRNKKEWIAFNCANLTPTLATSQLFGYKKGAFTGADSDRDGLVFAAKDSTLFLDEIGELPIETQSHFLRFLQDGTFQPLGSNTTYSSNARIIAATNRNLEEEVKRGNFREDLYYRLKVLTIEVPPLRERKEDIPILFEYFLKSECEKENIKKPEIGKGVVFKLLSHNFYGNVRELQNLTKRLIVSSLVTGIIEERKIEFEKSPKISGKVTLEGKLKEYEMELIREILKRNSFNIKESAKEAGLSRQAFYQRAKRFGIL